MHFVVGSAHKYDGRVAAALVYEAAAAQSSETARVQEKKKASQYRIAQIYFSSVRYISDVML